MGEARRRRLAGGLPEGREAVAAYVAAMRDDGRAAMRRFAEQALERGPGRRLASSEVMPVAQALADPQLGPGTLEALVAVFAAAHDLGPGDLMCECSTCRALWTRERVPAAAVIIRILDPEAVHLAFLCEACACAPLPELRRRVLAMLRHDFFDGEGEEVTLAPEGGTA